MESHNRLRTLQQQLAQKGHWEAQLQALKDQQALLKRNVQALEKAKQSEQADVDRLEGRTDLDESRAILVDTCEDDHLAAIAREILQGRFDEVLEAKAGCTIFSHCGPRTLGVLLLRK